ncbi:MAG: ferredoxin [Candidatus Margulisbacteria bacterium]|nr:ferredoxin [Candidatus Margulisiibacteriota bacterium]MBU1617719.1 ferredoxin [Candidatus Margulisiibacteriota bacterium]MBU1866852.1 ferredoxin [Candidatus Margulisiibacteriota bacterium]
MVSVDQALCIGCGVCVDMCPDVFTMTSEGKAQAIKNDSENCSLEDVAGACPVDAINI